MRETETLGDAIGMEAVSFHGERIRGGRGDSQGFFWKGAFRSALRACGGAWLGCPAGRRGTGGDIRGTFVAPGSLGKEDGM